MRGYNLTATEIPDERYAPQSRMRGYTGSGFIPPHSRPGFAGPPSPKRGFSSEQPPPEVAFPRGEGSLPAGVEKIPRFSTWVVENRGFVYLIYSNCKS